MSWNLETDDTVAPHVHLNGTKGTDLFEGLAVILQALRSAERQLEIYAPNRRDYYTFGDDLWRSACEQQWARQKALKQVRESVERELSLVSDQLDGGAS